MDHIRLRDWCLTRRQNEGFVDEQDIENCSIEKIIRNKFWDPLISSDEEDDPKRIIDWQAIFKNQNANEQQFRVFVPGFRSPPAHPKLSALTKDEHRQCLKVLSIKNKHVLSKEFLGRPSKADQRLFEEKKEVYTAEQKEYIEWAKQLWITTNCIRALRPKPMVEMVYEAEYKMKSHMMQCFPKTYILAAQIPLQSEYHNCEIVMAKKDLIQVDISKLPEVVYPNISESKVSVLQACAVPEPCAQHPCRFKLPHEKSESLLPLTEIHKELAQFAIENGADYIASENAIKCILEMDRSWTLPLSVCEVISADGVISNVVVLQSEFPVKKDPAPIRSYRAFKHFLLKGFTSKSARSRMFSESSDASRSSGPSRNLRPRRGYTCKQTSDVSSTRCTRVTKESINAAVIYTNKLRKIIDQMEASDSDEGDRLQIDMDEDSQKGEVLRYEPDEEPVEEANKTNEKRHNSTDQDLAQPRKVLKARRSTSQRDNENNHDNNNEDIHKNNHNDNFENEIGHFNCVCKDSELDMPAPRSYKNCQINNHTTRDKVNLIIHSSHKLKNNKSNEVILEPIVEYQLDIGGTVQSSQKIQSLAFSLMLRKNAELVNVRVDGTGGELVTIETTNLRELSANHGSFQADTANAIFTTLNQLAGLLPGAYLLRHEPAHGSNAMLYRRVVSGTTAVLKDADIVSLKEADRVLLPAEEARFVQTVPALAPVLLPYHKFRRQLPLAFTYDQRQIVKESKKPAYKNKTPPAAIQWPKRKRGKNKKKSKINN